MFIYAFIYICIVPVYLQKSDDLFFDTHKRLFTAMFHTPHSSIAASALPVLCLPHPIPFLPHPIPFLPHPIPETQELEAPLKVPVEDSLGFMEIRLDILESFNAAYSAMRRTRTQRVEAASAAHDRFVEQHPVLSRLVPRWVYSSLWLSSSSVRQAAKESGG